METVSVVDEHGQKSNGVIVTKEEMADWEEEKYRLSGEAVRTLPGAYKELKAAILASMYPLDVSRWHSLATRIANACKRLTVPNPGTIFYYPMKNIDPEIYGSAVNFRPEVEKLNDRVSILDSRLDQNKIG